MPLRIGALREIIHKCFYEFLQIGNVLVILPFNRSTQFLLQLIQLIFYLFKKVYGIKANIRAYCVADSNDTIWFELDLVLQLCLLFENFLFLLCILEPHLKMDKQIK